MQTTCYNEALQKANFTFMGSGHLAKKAANI